MSEPFQTYKDTYYDQSVTDQDGNVFGAKVEHDHVRENQDHEERPAKPKMIMGKHDNG